VALSVLRVCRYAVAGLLLTMSCGLLLAVLAARLDVEWLLVLGVSGVRKSGTSRNRRALLDNSTRDRTDRPLFLLACYTRDSPGVTPGLS